MRISGQSHTEDRVRLDEHRWACVLIKSTAQSQASFIMVVQCWCPKYEQQLVARSYPQHEGCLTSIKDYNKSLQARPLHPPMEQGRL